MNRSVLRIVDANLNRALEGLRAAEDVLRFWCNDRRIVGRLRRTRHALGALYAGSRRTLLAARDSVRDAGRRNPERRYRDVTQMLAANFRRAEESLRVLEETAKLANPRLVGALKRLRYTVYDLERRAGGIPLTQPPADKRMVR